MTANSVPRNSRTSAFLAMGTTITLVTVELGEREHRATLSAIRAHFARFEARLSRFDPSSELSRLNRARAPFHASALLFESVARSVEAFESTGGLFDPTVANTLVAQGYDRSIDEGSLDRDEPAARAPVPTMRAVSLAPGTRTISLRDGAALDLGGIAKGLCLDAAQSLLPERCALDAGGDLLLRGRDAEGLPWLVEVEDPRDADAVIARFEATHAAVATSATNRRRWRRAGVLVHHLIDPTTACAADSDVAQVTVLAESAARAEVLSKSALIAGAARGRAMLESSAARALMVTRDGSLQIIGDLECVCE